MAGKIRTFWATMSSLEDGFDGGVEDMLSGAEVNYGRKPILSQSSHIQ